MSCFGIREARRRERERQRQHELDLLAAARPTAGENFVTGIKWVCGSVAAVVLVPPLIIGAGATATLDAAVAISGAAPVRGKR